MGLFSSIASVFTGGGSNATVKLLEGATKVADKLFDDPESKRQFVLNAQQMEIEDRQGARSLYAKDSMIQKVMAVAFTVAFFWITKILIDHFFGGHTISDAGLTFVSMLFGHMSSKVNTIIDFFFGGSTKDVRENIPSSTPSERWDLREQKEANKQARKMARIEAKNDKD